MARLDNQRRLRLTAGDLGRLFLFGGCLAAAALQLPNGIYDYVHSRIILTVGLLGIWRYSWWLTHFVRAQLYGRRVFPPLRRQADKLWADGWRPRRVLFMIATYRERPDITDKLIASVADECRRTGIPGRVFIGTGDFTDELAIEDAVRRRAPDLDLQVHFIRQHLPGKRVAIGLALRALSRHDTYPDDLVVFMDGDSALEPHLLRKCLPLFALDPLLAAVTTDEQALVRGAGWMQRWWNLRLAQRHLVMQSHALSGKLLTLTGRLSIYRAPVVLREDFIRIVEGDELDHWLWGRFRFVSGDDKSTVYALLRDPKGTRMLYVPDAVASTTEVVEGSALGRMRDNLLRWSGNMLRNGRRCILLGPRQVGGFLWWCLVDQHIAIWTTLVGAATALIFTLFGGPVHLAAAILWVLTTRFVLSLFLFCYLGRVDSWAPVLLYCNQTGGALIKVYLLFHLASQRWRNRRDDIAIEPKGLAARYRTIMAGYLTAFYVGLFALGLMLFYLVLPTPRWELLSDVFRAR